MSDFCKFRFYSEKKNSPISTKYCWDTLSLSLLSLSISQSQPFSLSLSFNPIGLRDFYHTAFGTCYCALWVLVPLPYRWLVTTEVLGSNPAILATVIEHLFALHCSKDQNSEKLVGNGPLEKAKRLKLMLCRLSRVSSIIYVKKMNLN